MLELGDLALASLRIILQFGALGGLGFLPFDRLQQPRFGVSLALSPFALLAAGGPNALAIGGVSLRGIESMLRYGIDTLPLPAVVEELDIALVHENVRGADYYRERVRAATEVEGC